MSELPPFNLTDIAIIGMSGRFPGADTLDAFWKNLRDGVESITFFSDEQLTAAGVDAALHHQPSYVKASGVLSDIEQFDAHFFGYSPGEATIIDPQHRLFLECASAAIEHAGYDPERYRGLIGVYAGTGMNTYLYNNLYGWESHADPDEDYRTMIASDKDFLATRVSYKLNLKGPSVTVQTACSTSLVAVHLACQSLRGGECDIALAGGVSLRVPHQAGYLYQEGMILSPDGHCRAFDADARGTVMGSGVGVVVLKLLTDALADGDPIHAIIKGSTINNDGALKAGYTAPNLDAQAAVIVEAQGIAGVAPDSISYVETHGTGTPIGDPIEISALTKAFHTGTDRKRFCAIGSVKTNIGHLDAAAGMAGLIKTVLSLQHKQIPPSLNFETPNARINFDDTPFYVNTELSEWHTQGEPRRAGISSFGIGGTNVHVIMEEAPSIPSPGATRPWQLLPLSAKTDSALTAVSNNLAAYLTDNTHENLADVAFTLQVGRRLFPQRQFLICRNREDAIDALSNLDSGRIFRGASELVSRSVAAMFTGQGAQYVNMTAELYRTEPVFRQYVDQCCALLIPQLGLDLRSVIYETEEGQLEETTQKLNQTYLAQPALFTIEYALVKLWASWGVQPKAMIGHSIGEYVAACLAGVFSLEDALTLVAARGRLMQSLPGGAMLAVSCSEPEALSFLTEDLSLAAVNTPTSCVISGSTEAVDRLSQRLERRGITWRQLHTSHAFHSEMMEPILAPFMAQVRQISLNPPQIPYISNVTGTWITEAEATDPLYWARHLRQAVRFADGLSILLGDPEMALLEIGPGRTLSTLAMRHPSRSTDQVILASVRHPQDRQSDVAFLLTSLGKLWLAGMPINWSGFSAQEQRQRVALPTYPFERQRYWIDRDDTAVMHRGKIADVRKPEMADWFYTPSWKRAPLAPQQRGFLRHEAPWLVFVDACGLGAELVQRLRQAGETVVVVQAAAEFTVIDENAYGLNPVQAQDYDALLSALAVAGIRPLQIVHLWNVTSYKAASTTLATLEQLSSLAFNSLLFLAQALGRQYLHDEIVITVISNHMQEVLGTELLSPLKALLLGPVRTIPLEYPQLQCRSVDIGYEPGDQNSSRVVDMVWSEVTVNPDDQIVAYRGSHRWVEAFTAVSLPASSEPGIQVKPGGVYLITGGLGGIGFTLAQDLAKQGQPRLILIGRTVLPLREAWPQWLSDHAEADAVSQKIRRVQDLESLGAAVRVVSADVTSYEQMQQTVTQTVDLYGQINGVIHAAGVPGGGMIQRKTITNAAHVMMPKVKGTLALYAALQEIDLDFFVFCSSLNAILSRLGQVDYTAANAFLDAFVHYYNGIRGQTAVCINWETWRETGMAVTAASQFPELPSLPPKAENPPIHPLLEHGSVSGTERHTYATHFKVSKHWVLHEHGVLGQATLPGTTYLEMVHAAFVRHVGDQPHEIQDVHFLIPLTFDGTEERIVYTVIHKQGDSFNFIIASQPDPNKDEWQEHARGRVAPLSAASSAHYDLQALEKQCHLQDYTDPFNNAQIGNFAIRHQVVSYDQSETDEPLLVPSTIILENSQSSSDRSMVFGPRWHSLKWVKLGSDQGLAYLELSEDFAADVQTYGLHPALLDLATSFLRLFTEQESYLPLSYGALKIQKALPARFYSYVRNRDRVAEGRTLSCDVSLFDEHGVLLVEIEEFTVMKVQNIQKLAAAPVAHLVASDIFSAAVPHRSLLPTDNSVVKDLAYGLSSTEGTAVFHRILSSGLPRVIVSTRDLPTRMAQIQADTAVLLAGATENAAPPKRKHPRPAMMTAYAAPRNEVEKKLSEIWQRVLGIEQVGIHDDFFELGGDSLLIAQIHRQFRESFAEDISIANLLQYPSIADLAEFLDRRKNESQPSFQKVQERADKQKDAIQRRKEAMLKRKKTKH